MRRLLALTGAVAISALAVPAVAGAASGSSSADLASVAPLLVAPIYQVPSATYVPKHFYTDGRQAEVAAEKSQTLLAIHHRTHPLLVTPFVWGEQPLHWYITFSYHGHILAEADVSPTGHLEHVWTGPQAVAVYARGEYSPLFNSWWVVVPFCVAFLLPFFDPRRLRRLLHLDALVLLSFMVSYALFDHEHLESAVWLAYPPMLYLMGRMLWTGFKGRRSGQRGSDRSSPLVPTAALWAGLLVLVGARIALDLVSHQVIDVGVASAVGAHRIQLGQPLYYNTSAHNDTYGPVAYLAYVPFLIAFGWHGLFGFIAAAKAAPIAFDVITVAALVLLGRRLRSGGEGTRLGLKLAWAWAACPLTLLAMIMHTNDGLIAMLSVLSLLAFSSPAARGALLGLAAAAKFTPAGLLPLYARTRARGLKGTVSCVIVCCAVIVLAIAAYLPSGGLHYFYERTVGFQLTRPDVFSPWALHPSLDLVKVALEVFAVVLALVVFFFPRGKGERPVTQVCALAAAVTIAIQLPAVHWFYYYVIWFLPFVLVALMAPWPALTAPDVEPTASVPAVPDEPVAAHELAVV